jgi:TolA-binding protein
VHDFPNDGRAEDAMFLRAEIRSRQGNVEGARQVARAYLARYPNGLRAPDARRMVSAP